MRIVLKGIVSSFGLLLLCACGFNIVETGAIAPYQIKNAIQQGASGLPYLVYSKTDLKKLDETCKLIPTYVTLDDTYRSAYGKKLEDVLPEGKTGQEFHDMREASQYFQKVLKDKGVARPEDYIFTSIDTAQEKGYILFAVVKRAEQSIKIGDKDDRNTYKKLGPQDRAFYHPYQFDMDGKMLDEIVDWAGYPNDCISEQSSQAVLITLTANEVLNHNTKRDFWVAEKRWNKGNFKKVIKEQDEKTCIACGFSNGFFKE